MVRLPARRVRILRAARVAAVCIAVLLQQIFPRELHDLVDRAQLVGWRFFEAFDDGDAVLRWDASRGLVRGTGEEQRDDGCEEQPSVFDRGCRFVDLRGWNTPNEEWTWHELGGDGPRHLVMLGCKRAALEETAHGEDPTVDFAYTTLCTPRLRLDEPRIEDAESVFEAFGQDVEVTRYLAWRPHEELEDARRAMRKRVERLAGGVEYSWTLVLAEANELVGIISVWPEGDAVELGFVLARAHWGCGLMCEAARAVTDWALETPGVSRAWATTDVDNRASARVLEKSGYASCGPFERAIVRPNLDSKPRPSLLFERRAV